jgi:hypothetical protein
MRSDKADNQLIALLSQPIVAKGLLMCLVLAGALLLWANLHASLGFDDAFMFYRYALHLRAGLGVSWNLDKIHTFGETSLLWGVVVWGASFLPLAPERILLLASSLSAVGAVIAMAFAVVLNARSSVLKSLSRAVFLMHGEIGRYRLGELFILFGPVTHRRFLRQNWPDEKDSRHE